MVMNRVSKGGSAFLAVAAMIGWVVAAHATILVSNTFNTGLDSYPASPTYSEMGVDSNSSSDLESAWFWGGAGTLDPVGAGGPERGNLTGTGASSASWTTYFTPEGSEVNLALGESLKITWVFTLSGVNAGNTSQNFRLAVVNTPGAARLTVDGAPGSAAYTGYSMFMNMGPTMGNGNSFQLREFGVASGALLSSSGNWTALTNGVASGSTGYAAATTYTYTMVLSRVASGLDIVSTMSGGSVGGTGTMTDSYLDTTPNGGSYAFDTFSLRPSGESTTASIFDTSLFKVEYSAIPEPSSLAFLAGGLSLMAILMRRRS
jgi:hypothetical protein